MRHAPFLVRALGAGLLIGFGYGLVPGCTNDHVLAFLDPEPAPTEPPDGSPEPLDARACGNGVLDLGEGCDDGNAQSGDGCSAECVVETVAAPTTCPGAPLVLTVQDGKRVGSVSGTTVGAAATLDSVRCGGHNGKDVAYAITSDVQGQAVFRLEADFDAILSTRAICRDSGAELSCKNVAPGADDAELRVPVSKNQTLFVVIDGVGGASGNYRLDVEISATACGDGVAQYPEQCDDGDTAPGDGCSATCQLEGSDPGAGHCPGIAFRFAEPKTISLAGDLSLLGTTMGAVGCSSSAGGKDQAYAITSAVDGTITAVLHADYPESAMHVRRECFTSTTEVNCSASSRASVPLRLSFPVHAQETHTLFVDSKGSATFATGGKYSLELSLAAESCGNGVVDPSEQCDDGNAEAGDGCAPTCVLEPMPVGIDTCPGAPITFATAAGGKLTFRTTASTTPLHADAKAECGGLQKKDAVYSFVSPIHGYLTAKAKGSFNLVLDLRKACRLESATGVDDGSVACVDEHGGDDEERLQAAIEAGKTYYVVIDGPSASGNLEGTFTLDMEIRPSVCGNGILEGGEPCDDGATTDGDGCSASCQIEPRPTTRTNCATADELALAETTPGSAVYGASVRSGNWHMPDGTATFAPPCGAVGKEVFYSVIAPLDGVLVAAVPEASYNVSLGARDVCVDPAKGAGFLACSSNRVPGSERIAFPVTRGKKYWIIVDAPSASSLGRFRLDVSVKAATCGDGVIFGSEECDDGNVAAGDGCSATCKLEPLAGTNQCPGYAVMLSGIGSAPRIKTVTISTTMLTSEYSGTCGGVGRDGVVAVTSDISGEMTALLTTPWPAVVYAREACTDSASELDCDRADPTKPHERTRAVTFPAIAGIPAYFFVDSLAGDAGPATLTFTVLP